MVQLQRTENFRWKEVKTDGVGYNSGANDGGVGEWWWTGGGIAVVVE